MENCGGNDVVQVVCEGFSPCHLQRSSMESDGLGQDATLPNGNRRHADCDPSAINEIATDRSPDLGSSYTNSDGASQKSRAAELDNAPQICSGQGMNPKGRGARRNPSLISSERGVDSESVGAIDHCPLALITVMTLLTLCAGRINSIVMNQYLYQAFAKTVFGNVSVDTSKHPCADNTNTTNSTERKLVEHVQDLTSKMTLYLDMTLYGISAVSDMLLGTFSIVLSRKLMLLIPGIGYLVKLSLIPVIVHWELDVNWFYLGYTVDGICGSAVGVLLGTYLYISDVTPRNSKRTLGMATVETIRGIVGALSSGATGQLVERTGYIIPSSTAAGFQLLAVCVVMVLPDRKPAILNKDKIVLSVKGGILYMFSPFHAPKDARVKQMVTLAIAALLFIFLARFGGEKVETLYVMNFPFCFNAITIGWYMLGRGVGQNISTFLIIFLCYRFLPGMGLGIVSGLSTLAGFLMYAFADATWQIYLVPVLSMAQQVVFSMIKGESSRLLDPEFQGPLFASIAVMESICLTAGSSLGLAIYNASLGFFTGLAFVDSGFIIVATVLLSVFQRMWLRYMRAVRYNTLEF